MGPPKVSALGFKRQWMSPDFSVSPHRGPLYHGDTHVLVSALPWHLILFGGRRCWCGRIDIVPVQTWRGWQMLWAGGVFRKLAPSVDLVVWSVTAPSSPALSHAPGPPGFPRRRDAVLAPVTLCCCFQVWGEESECTKGVIIKTSNSLLSHPWTWAAFHWWIAINFRH